MLEPTHIALDLDVANNDYATQVAPSYGLKKYETHRF